ncbi:AzlD domain-containing protein [Sedimenticola selenatireducens]|jgi:branched-subunit amino acid transport protein|uniref:AzlD domain-containing protein n=1 Tax=Sedimenticola selenatireducens TaxID=191960 RepID=A0A558DN47_9GAMM|nr:AzlD domain-containing protein [Sedimenticola selenatireducens]TVO74916.1 AzlD domain-containing protein [Sedimenticola selenatireducens]TVT62452.1 MAG: AzlD domain-containing protein [Sedimenticola selenatireducens]
MLSAWTVWIVIVCLGLGTYLIRFSFLGLIGGRELPEWFLRHLRYVAVAVMPALITPLVIWPEATQGEPDPARLIAALAAFVIGIKFNSVIGAILAGMISLYGVQYLLN